MNKDTFKTSFSKNLVSWYKKNKRALPFRENKDPYRVWLSEIILQQTQMETGLKYYKIFISAFPDVNTLASSSQKKIGYYNIKYKYSADYYLFYRMIVKFKLIGTSTKKNEINVRNKVHDRRNKNRSFWI